MRTLFALLLAALAFAPSSISQPAPATFELYIDEVYDQLNGGAVVFSVAFRDPLTRRVNPPLKVHAGDPVAIKLINRTSKTRSFAIMSVAGATSTPIRAGSSAVVRFKAPPVGSYIYNDPSQGKTGETRTLFGDFVVLARPS
jgi:FtsP/CotA-like multicopper oxidase with cupredoxin domain